MTIREIVESDRLESVPSTDRYEVAASKRVAAMLASGKQAWVYVDARLAP